MLHIFCFARAPSPLALRCLEELYERRQTPYFILFQSSSCIVEASKTKELRAAHIFHCRNSTTYCLQALLNGLGGEHFCFHSFLLCWSMFSLVQGWQKCNSCLFFFLQGVEVYPFFMVLFGSHQSINYWWELDLQLFLTRLDLV